MNKLYIKIASEGLLDVNLLKIIGFSTKRGDDTKFGHFGSGSKYALALLFRNKIPFHLFSGKKEILFGTQIQEYYNSGEAYQTEVITINGEPTAFSTELGPDWEPWMILRELISNARDQDPDNAEITLTSEIELSENTTTWYLNVTKHSFMVAELDRTFKDEPFFHSQRNPIYEDLYEKGHPTEQSIVYSKGVRAGNTPKMALFHIGGRNIGIDERRIYRSFHESYYGSLLMRIKDKNYIYKILDAFNNNESQEWDLFRWGSVTDISLQWQEILSTVNVLPATMESFKQYLDDPSKKTYLVSVDTYKVLEPYLKSSLKSSGDKIYKILAVQPGDESFWELVNNAIDIIANYDGNIYKWPVKVALFNKENTLGTVDRDEQQIIISEQYTRVPTLGTLVSLVSVIFEEFSHGEYHYNDETRRFQTYLLDLLAQAMIEKSQNIVKF